MTRGALTTFSIANDVAKYFAIIPAMFAGAFPVLNALNIMRLQDSAVGDFVGGNLQRADLNFFQQPAAERLRWRDSACPGLFTNSGLA